MDERDLLGHMRMGVDLVRYAMGRPAGMADPGKTGKPIRFQHFFEIFEFAFRATAIDPVLG